MIFQRLQLAVIQRQRQFGLRDMCRDVGRLDGFFGGVAVGSGQAAGAQFDAAEIADHDDDRVHQVFAFQMLEDRLAGRAGGFAGVVEAANQTVLIEYPVREHDMVGVRVLLVALMQQGVGFFFGLARADDADEAGLFDDVFDDDGLLDD